MSNNEYIPRSDVIEIAMEWCPDDDGSVGKVGDLREMLDELESIPAADVEEKRYGQWVKAQDRGIVSYSELYAECSVCHGEPVFAGRMYKRCPHCGAYLTLTGEGK